jgi:hypothetical protein
MFGKQFVDGLSNGRRYLLKEGMAYEYNKIVEWEPVQPWLARENQSKWEQG